MFETSRTAADVLGEGFSQETKAKPWKHAKREESHLIKLGLSGQADQMRWHFLLSQGVSSATTSSIWTERVNERAAFTTNLFNDFDQAGLKQLLSYATHAAITLLPSFSGLSRQFFIQVLGRSEEARCRRHLQVARRESPQSTDSIETFFTDLLTRGALSKFKLATYVSPEMEVSQMVSPAMDVLSADVESKFSTPLEHLLPRP